MTPMSYYRINTYYPALDKVQLQLETRISSNDNEILYSLSDIILNDEPDQKSFSTVCNFYSLDEEVLWADFMIYKSFKE